MAVAAYASLVSLVNVRDHVQLYHSLHNVFDADRQRQFETLDEKVRFLLKFLQECSLSSNETKSLSSRITDAAHAAEDIIETYIVDDVTHRFKHKKSSRDVNGLKRFFDELREVIVSFGSIQREVVRIKEEGRAVNDLPPQELDQVRSVGGDTLVGFDCDFDSIMKKVYLRDTSLQIISITGMGGIGKSTLAKKVFDHERAKQWFDVFGWVTVSQDFDVKDMFLGLLSQTGGQGSKSSEVHELGEKLHKQLYGRRYLIIIDDIWSVKAWDKVQLHLKDSKNSSRVIITTRLLNLANTIGSSSIHRMSLLGEDESWSLLCSKVFVKESCPPDLERAGKQIAVKCEGLPLSIIVIAGLLAKSKNKRYWESIAGKVSASVNSEDSERCLKILHLSYRHLPIHLKACFLYFAVYSEDCEIDVPQLIRLWIAEGFLQPDRHKILEEVAKDYVQDLIGRNLIIVTRSGSMGDVQVIRIHDLVRDLCLREAYEENMLNAVSMDGSAVFPRHYSNQRLVISGRNQWRKYAPPRLHTLQSSLALRSLTCNCQLSSEPSLDVKLLRVVRMFRSGLFRVIPKLVNSRYLEFPYKSEDISVFFESAYLLWNLQTIYIPKYGIWAPSKIWKMPQLRHVMVEVLHLPDPEGQDDGIVLENLQTLKNVIDFKCTEEVLRKIPNIRELSITTKARKWYDAKKKYMWPSYCLGNLARLQKIESLRCESFIKHETESCCVGFNSIGFSHSLKEVSLIRCDFDWEDLGTKIGSLPLLEVLKLENCSTGEEWNSIEGQFPSLKVLCICISTLTKIVRWTAGSYDFPSLELLKISGMGCLEEIPSEIGDIPTLKCIDVAYCYGPICASAERIREEQESLGNNLSVLLPSSRSME